MLSSGPLFLFRKCIQPHCVDKVDEDEFGGLRGLADVLLGYGERHFDGAPGQKGARRGVWAGVLLMCGQFERVSVLVAR